MKQDEKDLNNSYKEYSIDDILMETAKLKEQNEQKEKKEIENRISEVISDKKASASNNQSKHDSSKLEFIKDIVNKKNDHKKNKVEEIFSRNDNKVKTSLLNPLDYKEENDSQVTFDEVIKINKDDNRAKDAPKRANNPESKSKKSSDNEGKASKKETPKKEKANSSKKTVKSKKNKQKETKKRLYTSSNVNNKISKSKGEDPEIDLNKNQLELEQTTTKDNSPKKLSGKLPKNRTVVISDMQDEPIDIIKAESIIYEDYKNIDKKIRSTINKKDQTSRKFSIFGCVEEAEEPEESNDETKPIEIIDDYTRKKDVALIKRELSRNKVRLLLRLIITFVTMLSSVTISVLFRTNLPFIENNANLNSLYLFYNLLLMSISIVACISVMINGLKSIFKMRVTADTTVALSSVACMIQIMLAYINAGKFNPRSGLYLYACIAMIGLFFNTLGKYFIILRVKNNFAFLTSTAPKYAAKICSDNETIRQVSDAVDMNRPIIVYQKQTDFLSNFLKLSYAPDPCEEISRSIAPIGMIICVLVGAVEFIFTFDIFKSVSAMALAICMATPMSCAAAASIPIYNLCKIALKRGAMLSGFLGVQQFADTNCVIVDSDELYRRGSITLKGIKTFGSERIDRSILCAAAVIKEAGGPMLPVFSQVIQGREYILPVAEDVKYIDAKGIIGTVNSQQILIGNRKLLEDYHIPPKSFDFENKYKNSGNEITYFAIDNELVAVFILSYTPDKTIAQELQRLEYNGINVVVRTVDQNITKEMVAKQFGLFLKTVNIIPVTNLKEHNKEKTRSLESSRAYLATKGSFSSLARLISASVRIKSNISLSIIIQIIAMVLGVTIITLITFYSGIEQIGPVGLIIYTLFWIFAAIFAPSIRKP